MKGIFSWILIIWENCTGILIVIFTIGLADGTTDITDDENTASQMGGMITSQVGWQTNKSCNGHMDCLVSMML